ncbi:hypothetical protein BD779DRAFT_1674322 [Infundibulicybe gibba]|nr:hypothetical protein BD779DRAFT_1674322 [Infundibulicybe gibba]
MSDVIPSGTKLQDIQTTWIKLPSVGINYQMMVDGRSPVPTFQAVPWKRADLLETLLRMGRSLIQSTEVVPGQMLRYIMERISMENLGFGAQALDLISIEHQIHHFKSSGSVGMGFFLTPPTGKWSIAALGILDRLQTDELINETSRFGRDPTTYKQRADSNWAGVTQCLALDGVVARVNSNIMRV